MIQSSLLLKIKQHMQNFWTDFKSVYFLIVKNGKSRFLLSMILTSVQWVCRYSVISALLASMDIAVDPVQSFVLQWFVFTLMNFIPTPGATAGAEASFYFIYESLLPGDIIGLVTTGWRFLTFYFLLIVGSVLLILLNMPANIFKKLFKRPSVQPVGISFD